MFIIPVTRMEGVGDLTDLKKDSTVKAVPEKRFDSVLKEAVREADQAIKDTQIMDMKLASGQVDNLHTALIQAEKTAVEFTTQITTKAVNAYNQIMGMQV
mgnify:CR=1 FL=1